MPLYEYVCQNCRKKFQEVLTVKEHDVKKIKCPHCDSVAVERIFEPFFARTARKSAGW